MSNLEIINTNNENSFDPTPKLKSSPIPILFISFSGLQDYCNHCGNEYSMAIAFNQKYCKICFLKYIEDTNDTYLDIRMSKNDTRHDKHETNRNVNFCTQNQKIFENHFEISYFKQIISYIHLSKRQKLEESEDCDLCGKLIPQQGFLFRICPDCYQISGGRIKSTLTKKYVPILHLPWWDNCDICIVCKQGLDFINDCQKWCLNCFYTLYIGCRYCLTTNIIFGITDQSQCRKCKKVSFIDFDITNINSGNISIERFFASTREIINWKMVYSLNNQVKNSNPIEIYDYFFKYKLEYSSLKPLIEWIPYSRITNLEETAVGGFSIIYKANCLFQRYKRTKYFRTVAIKRYLSSQEYFLNELKLLYKYHECIRIISCYGVTQDPETKEYMIVMNYANGGNLNKYLQENFANITWEMKLNILLDITIGLYSIHARNFIHRDLHSGNILLNNSSWLICDLGLSQDANNTSLNNKIYGVIPYIAPEIFNGVAFSKLSDIYSMGMIMWELTTGCKPFANLEYNTNLMYKIIDGIRPEITNDTPECIANLMERCWNSNPAERPSALDIYNVLSVAKVKCSAQFNQAEENRLELIKLKKLGPESTGKSHSSAIYTSRLFESRVLNSLSNNSLLSKNLVNMKQEYVTKEYDYDINVRNQQYITKEYDYDINAQKLTKIDLIVE
ncbi:hypothetical protein RclHR1_01510020 [Rhizophagus clarus]|uniref:Kinase-like domain-containing protein n=1 Tax=Rhizophagus clarus TaxID=94130 RepID=A0A2Z6QRU7_9GLOM|nr:hypothetical protein RclHR1_01510020 [Rhizophagus clarus]GES93035.1 kinase-like domain-containing protein [Rhizophagus clarus]